MVKRSPVLAVVLNWNRADLSCTCVSHVLAQRGADADLLVIDNGSTDDSVGTIRASGLDVAVIALDRNCGFATGMNVGLQHALDHGYEFVWLLNNDAFADPHCLASLLERMRADPRLGMLTPRILWSDGREQHVGGSVDWSTAALQVDIASAMETPRTRGSWLTGTAPLLRVSVIGGVGLFEPDFFAYWEDVDLSVRITARDLTIAAEPTANVTHLGSASTGGYDSPLASFLMTRNAWLFLQRNTLPRNRRAHWLRYMAAMLARAAEYEQRGMASTVVTAVVSGVSAARKNRFGPPPGRPEPSHLERILFSHPYRAAQYARRVADVLDPTSAVEPIGPCPC